MEVYVLHGRPHHFIAICVFLPISCHQSQSAGPSDSTRPFQSGFYLIPIIGGVLILGSWQLCSCPYIWIWRRCTAQLTLLLNKPIYRVCFGSRDRRTAKCVIGYMLHALHKQVSGSRLMRSHEWSGGQVYPVKASTCPYMGDHVIEQRSCHPEHAPYNMDLLWSKMSWIV